MNKIIWFIFYYSAKLNMHLIGAFLYYLSLKCVKKGCSGAAKIIILSKTELYNDIMSACSDDNVFQFYTSNPMILKAIANAYLPPEINNDNYIFDTWILKLCRKRYHDFLYKFMKRLLIFMNVKAIITANWGYYAERELATICERDLNIAFIVLHKENLKTEEGKIYWGNLYKEKRGKFTGRKILVYNEIEKAIQLKAGVSEKIQVIGMPRLDRYHNWRRNIRQDYKPPKQVLYFFFHEKTNISGSKIRFTQLANETNQAIYEFTMQNPDIQMIIKARNKLEDLYYLDQISYKFDNLSNIKIIRGGDPFELIISSRVIVAFNTTAMFEGIASGIPVVVPAYGEIIEHPEHYINCGIAVQYAHYSMTLKSILLYYCNNYFDLTFLPNYEKVILDKYCGNSDGRAGIRLKKELYNEVFK